MLTRRRVCQSLAAGGLATAGAGAWALHTSARAATAGRVTMQAAWINDAEFIGYFVALRNGYYSAQSVDMHYLSGGPDVIPESSLLAGKAAAMSVLS